MATHRWLPIGTTLHRLGIDHGSHAGASSRPSAGVHRSHSRPRTDRPTDHLWDELGGGSNLNLIGGHHYLSDTCVAATMAARLVARWRR
jgi:hypothetical protein